MGCGRIVVPAHHPTGLGNSSGSEKIYNGLEKIVTLSVLMIFVGLIVVAVKIGNR